MKKITLCVLVLFASVAFAARNPADYPETLHVTGSHMVMDDFGTNISHAQQLDVVTKGVKYQLIGIPPLLSDSGHAVGFVHPGLLPIGDYKAKPVKKDHKPDYLLFLSYEILLPDGKTATFEVVGQTE